MNYSCDLGSVLIYLRCSPQWIAGSLISCADEMMSWSKMA